MEHLHLPADPSAFLAANQRWLVAALALLQAYIEGAKGETLEPKKQALAEVEAAMPSAPALLVLAERLGLSLFERDLLLLCAGVELDSAFASLCASAQGHRERPQPTFSFAMAVLPGAYWSALGPAAPLRRLHLIELSPGETLTRSPLRIDERVLHAILGVLQPDERLAPVLDFPAPPAEFVPSQGHYVERITNIWKRAKQRAFVPVAVLCGEDYPAKLEIAAAACKKLKMGLARFSPNGLGEASKDLLLARLLEREVLLGGNAILIDAQEVDAGADASRWAAIQRLVERVPSPLFVAAANHFRPLQRPAFSVDIRRPAPSEQRRLWRDTLQSHLLCSQPETLEALSEPLASRFDLGAASIRAVCEVSAGDMNEATPDQWLPLLWDACRAESRPRLDELAARIETQAKWEDLVLPEPQRMILCELASHIRHRVRVYEEWGMSQGASHGLGVSVLFSGPSGTGKTLAAEVLAGELHLDLYRVDLSQLVSKYIGETEKNLRRIFDAAEQGAAILLFDEAEALFGRRTEVRDSHDRYANLEVAYLLQRMEAYRGLCILTTNAKDALDPAFARRLRFIVDFPFPSEAERALIWRKALSPALSMGHLESKRLGRLRLSGGSIYSIALNAAFLAAESGSSPEIKYIFQAIRSEYAKLGRPVPAVLSEIEQKGNEEE